MKELTLENGIELHSAVPYDELQEKIAEASTPKKQSILDDIPGTQIPDLEETFEGGFVINTDLDEKDE